jgi:hypothetical protein
MSRKITAVLFLPFVLSLAVESSVVVSAQEMREMPAAKCTGALAPLPAVLSGWANKADINAATQRTGLASAMLKPGQGATVALHPTRQVHYLSQPEKPGGSVASGGLVGFHIAEAGIYQVSLDSGAWLDVVKDGAMLISTAHAPGPACTGIRKTVQFELKPADYVMQISANANPHIAVMVSRVK